jgi:hypothetical protein
MRWRGHKFNQNPAVAVQGAGGNVYFAWLRFQF